MVYRMSFRRRPLGMLNGFTTLVAILILAQIVPGRGVAQGLGPTDRLPTAVSPTDAKSRSSQAPQTATLDSGLQVTVFPQRVVIRCEFSLTVDSARLLAEGPSVLEGPPVTAAGDRLKVETIASAGVTNDANRALQPNEPTRNPQVSPVDQPVTSERGQEPGVEKAADERYELMVRFQERAVPELLSRLRVLVDGQPVALQFLAATRFPKHYVQLACDFEAPMPVGTPMRRLEVRYGCFRGIAGQQRIAIRGKDGVEIRSASVPPILARFSSTARPVGSAESIEASRRAEAVFVVSKTDEQPASATDSPAVNGVEGIRPGSPAAVPRIPATLAENRAGRVASETGSTPDIGTPDIGKSRLEKHGAFAARFSLSRLVVVFGLSGLILLIGVGLLLRYRRPSTF
jgi:hypothetical protein